MGASLDAAPRPPWNLEDATGVQRAQEPSQDARKRGHAKPLGESQMDTDNLENQLHADMKAMEDQLRRDMKAMEDRLRRHLTTRIYGAAALVTAVLGTINYVIG